MVVLVAVATRLVTNQYVFFAGYGVLQYIVLASAWNILGGYAGYVNFGTAAFFALGAYTSVVLGKLVPLPVPVMILAGGVVSGLVGVLMGVMTLRLRGVFFSICTLALAVVAQAAITNWDYVGGSSGAYVIPPRVGPLGGSYVEYLFLVMLILAGLAVGLARTIERSRIGDGLAAIRDDEGAAEALGVPTFRLKLAMTVISGALMGMAGAPLPYYTAYIDPSSGFALSYPVNTIAMALVGGTGKLGRAGGGSGVARHGAADGDGDDLVGCQHDGGGAAAGGVRQPGAEGDRGIGARPDRRTVPVATRQTNTEETRMNTEIGRRTAVAGALGMGALGRSARGAFRRARQAGPSPSACSLSLTGPLAVSGRAILLSLQMYEADFNKQGGMHGRPIKFIYYDDQSNPSNAPQIYTKLLDIDKVDLLMSNGTNLTAPAMPVVMQRDRLIVAMFSLGDQRQIPLSALLPDHAVRAERQDCHLQGILRRCGNHHSKGEDHRAGRRGRRLLQDRRRRGAGPREDDGAENRL